MSETTYRCNFCGMTDLTGQTFHPHVYCLIYLAGETNPERYMETQMPLLREHFDETQP